jgi:hypothetical protein
MLSKFVFATLPCFFLINVVSGCFCGFYGYLRLPVVSSKRVVWFGLWFFKENNNKNASSRARVNFFSCCCLFKKQQI